MRELAVGVATMMLLLLGAAPAAAEDRPIVAVFDVETKRVNLSNDILDALADFLASRLTETGKYQVVPRDQLKQRLTEAKKESYKLCYEQSCQIEMGRELAAGKTLSTQVSKFGDVCTFSVTLYDLKKAATEAAATEQGGCEEKELLKSLDSVVVKLAGTAKIKAQDASPSESPPPKAERKVEPVWIRSATAGIEFTKSEITVTQYRACVEAGKCTLAHNEDGSCDVYDGQAWNKGKLSASFQGDDQPVVCVDWGQADVYCNWAGGRLPSDEEWYAEASDNERRDFTWGGEEAACDSVVMDAAGKGCGHGSTWPVCSKEKGNSIHGLCDMSGNVWEWTSTSDGSLRVIRGGAWDAADQDSLRTSARLEYDLTSRYDDIGFRCGRSFR